MGFRSACKEELSDIAWTVYCPFYENHVNTTETLGKGQKSLCKGFTYKNYSCYWDRCQAKSGKLMFVANYTIVDWGSHGMWLSNCSDDIN